MRHTRTYQLLASLVLAGLFFCPAGSEAAPTARSEITMRVGESALLESLKAAAPQTITIGSSIASTDLVLSDPTDLVLADGIARFKVRLRGKTLPVDQILTPVVRVEYDTPRDRFYVVVSSLPLQLPGLGRIDLKDYIQRIEIPALFENLWRLSDRQLGMNLRVRRIAIVEHAVELGADVSFTPPAAGRAGESR